MDNCVTYFTAVCRTILRMTAHTSLKGQFLISMPQLQDPNFERTVIYLCDHSEDGALGLIVNRPSEMTLHELLEQVKIDPLAVPDQPVLRGGPVASNQGFILHSDEASYEASVHVGDGLMLSTALKTLQEIAVGAGPKEALITLGCASWGAGQLEEELAANAWLTCPAQSHVLFEVPYEQRINAAAATLGIDFNLIVSQAGHA